MKKQILLWASILFVMIPTLFTPVSFAEDIEVIYVEEEETGELVELEGTEDTPLDEGELSTYRYEIGTRELPENVTWANGRLILNFNWALIGEVGVQHGGQACACFSLAYCRTILDGTSYSYADFSLGTSEEDAYASWTLGSYEGYFPTDKQSAYEFIFSELCRGKPVVVRIEGPYTLLHYVAIVGFENVTDGLPLSAYNFLILDPGDPYYELENMGGKGFDLKKDGGTYQVEYDTTSASSPFVMDNSDYLRLCKEETANLYLKAVEQTNVMTLPCDTETNEETKKLVILEEGEIFIATARIENSRLECWFRGRTESGVSGYVSAGTMKKEEKQPLSIAHKKNCHVLYVCGTRWTQQVACIPAGRYFFLLEE